MIRTITFAAALLAATTTTQAAVYKCVVNGKTEFSDTPCAPNAQVHELRVSKPSDADATAATVRLQQTIDNESLESRRRMADLQINYAESSLRSLEKERDSEIAFLKVKQGMASNNLAGATWEQALATEMQAVIMRYDSKIQAVREEITKLRAERP
jgi:hypothetical protein